MTSRKPFPEAPDNSTLHKVQPGEYGHLLERVQAIAKSLNIPAPDVWVADSKSLQAESFPSNNVAVTTATLNLLNEREQDAILGHELGHRKDGDKDGFAGGLQVMAEFFTKGHLQEYRETQADTRSVEAAYASRLYSPDDLSSALKKFSAAGKTAGHDPSAMAELPLLLRGQAAVMKALPEKTLEEINSIGDRWNNLWATLHLNTHPSLEHRIENIDQQKQLHAKDGFKR
jgi:Zn-dependent protease with chaperone function